LSILLLLTLASLVAIGLIAFNQIDTVGEYALESSSSLGDKAINDSTKALTDRHMVSSPTCNFAAQNPTKVLEA
jgi:hypothetical protein